MIKRKYIFGMDLSSLHFEPLEGFIKDIFDLLKDLDSSYKSGTKFDCTCTLETINELILEVTDTMTKDDLNKTKKILSQILYVMDKIHITTEYESYPYISKYAIAKKVLEDFIERDMVTVNMTVLEDIPNKILKNEHNF
jgi:hypothetical protein